jgi:anti-sigma regulatory factor (Ser/Thr protein kinase)
MRVRYTIDNDGILWEIIDKRAKIGTRLTIAVGILSGSLKATGAGMTAASRQAEYVGWKKLSGVVYDTRRRMITLRNRRRTVMLVVCLPDNYDQVVAITKKKVIPTKGASV